MIPKGIYQNKQNALQMLSAGQDDPGPHAKLSILTPTPDFTSRPLAEKQTTDESGQGY